MSEMVIGHGRGLTPDQQRQAVGLSAIMHGARRRPRHPEHQYLDLLRELLDRGVYREGRNGGTHGLFGRHIRFDLAEGFPLLTTKKVFFGGVLDELCWFLSGSTNAYDLPERSQKWWTPWALADGRLGPIYGAQFRHARWWYEVEPLLFEVPEVAKRDGLFCGVGDIGPTAFERGQGPVEAMLKNTWRDMLKRCYDENTKSYPAYGGAGVHVDPEWLSFDNFSRDAKALQGWHLKLTYPDEYTIDKDVLHASNRYSKATCIWASHVEQSLNTSTGTPFWATDPDGERVFLPSFGEAVRRYGLNASACHRALNGLLHTHHNWSNFEYAVPQTGKVFRFREIDQLKRVIAGLMHDPNGRRHVINLWNTPAMEHAALPCCHGSIIQFHVSEGRLSCMMTQRSCDVFIGLPVNIASYALLTHLIAREVGLKPGDVVISLGDLHLYANHIEQAKEQLSRDPLPLPYITVPGNKPLFDLEPADVVLHHYHPHPAIKADVSV